MAPVLIGLLLWVTFLEGSASAEVNLTSAIRLKHICKLNVTSLCDSLYSGATTWAEADQFCASKGSHLASIRSQSEQDSITNFIGSASRIDRVWLGGRESENNTWMWMDGTPLIEHLNSQPVNRKTCAVIFSEQSSAKIISTECQEPLRTFVCSSSTNLCTGYSTAFVVAESGYCVYRWQSNLTWFEASSQCEAFGEQLASFNRYQPTKGDDSYLLNLTRLLGSGERAWLGLRRRRWQWLSEDTRTNTAGYTPFTYTNWAPGKPDNVNNRCLLLNLTSGGSWEDADCNSETSHFVCHSKTRLWGTAKPATTYRSVAPLSSSRTSTGRPTVTSTLFTQKTISEAGANEGTLLLVILPAIFGLLVIVAAIAIAIGLCIYFRRRKSRRAHGSPPVSYTVGVPGTTINPHTVTGQASQPQVVDQRSDQASREQSVPLSSGQASGQVGGDGFIRGDLNAVLISGQDTATGQCGGEYEHIKGGNLDPGSNQYAELGKLDPGSGQYAQIRAEPATPSEDCGPQEYEAMRPYRQDDPAAAASHVDEPGSPIYTNTTAYENLPIGHAAKK